MNEMNLIFFDHARIFEHDSVHGHILDSLRRVQNCDDSQDNSNILPLLGSVPGDYYIPRFLTTRVMIATPGYK